MRALDSRHQICWALQQPVSELFVPSLWYFWGWFYATYWREIAKIRSSVSIYNTLLCSCLDCMNIVSKSGCECSYYNRYMRVNMLQRSRGMCKSANTTLKYIKNPTLHLETYHLQNLFESQNHLKYSHQS